MKKTLTAAVIALAPFAASAHDVTLQTAMQGATLNENGIDLSVYWMATDTGAEVTGTYVTSWNQGAPGHVTMHLEPGEHTTFAIPGARQVAFNFRNTNGVIQVISVPSGNRLASR